MRVRTENGIFQWPVRPALCLLCLFATSLALADIVIVNRDGVAEGFNALTPVTPAGGNAAITLGQARLNAFRHAASLIDAMVDSSVPMRVDARMDPLGGEINAAVLGHAGTVTVLRDFTDAPLENTWYPSALANKLAGEDLTPEHGDIEATFNSDVDGALVLGSIGWYYGLDGNPTGHDVDFVSTVLHEIIHGLGFQTFVELETGSKLVGSDDAFMVHLEHHGASPAAFADMSDAQRVAAMTASGELHWSGDQVTSTANGHVEMYAPDPVEPGSSVAHFSTSLSPDDLMEPFSTQAYETALAAALLADIGWGSTEANPVIPSADLMLTATHTLDPLPEGTITYTALITNNSPAEATYATLVDVLPDGVSLVSASPGCVYDGGRVICDLQTIAGNAMRSVTITVQATQSGSVTNTLNVSSARLDPNVSNNTDSQTTTIEVNTVPDQPTPDNESPAAAPSDDDNAATHATSGGGAGDGGGGALGYLPVFLLALLVLVRQRL